MQRLPSAFSRSFLRRVSSFDTGSQKTTERSGLLLRSETADVLIKAGQHIIYNGRDQFPACIIVIMHQPVAQTGDFCPGNIGMCLFVFRRQIVCLFSDIVKRRCNRPLDRFAGQNVIFCDTGLFNVGQQLPCRITHFINPLAITILHAIFTPSLIML